jgi:hypothetical protein
VIGESASEDCQSPWTLSASIAFNRPQAEFSDGANDGRIEMARHEIVVFQMMFMRVGDDCVGATTCGWANCSCGAILAVLD